MNILLTTMHKGPIQAKKIKCINILETIQLGELLRKQGHNVTMATLKDTDVAVAYDKLDINSFDRVLVMNSTIDFPGGEENFYIEGLFEFLKKYKGTIYSILVDLAIPFQQLYPKIMNRQWCKYKTKEEIRLTNDIVILSQCHNLDEVKKIHQDKDLNVVDIKYIPINEWILHTNDFVENTGEVDLILGTSNRGGRRSDKYQDYMWGHEDLSAQFYGLIKEKNFNPKKVQGLKCPIFEPKLDDCRKIVEKNSTGFATIIMGDKNYNNNMVTLRLSESLLANCVTFIDEDFDSKHTIFPQYKFFYVKNGKELEIKIKELKQRPDIYKNVLRVQHELVEKLREKNMPQLFSDALK